MKKTTVSLFIIFIILFAVLACAPAAEEAASAPTAAPVCEHQWTEADCVSDGVCSLCGEVQAEALGHDWAEATCMSAEHCTRCDETRGEKLDHSYGKWLLDADSMYRLCTMCEDAEHTDIDYARYLEQYVYGRWNLCSTVENGIFCEGHALPQRKVDPEYIFHEDGRIVSFGFEEEELCTSWSIDRGEYDSADEQHRIYITSPEAPDLSLSYFTCFGDTVSFVIPLDDDGDTATLSNSFGDFMTELVVGTWSAWNTDGLSNITLAEDRSFTADIDGGISGFWQPRQPKSRPGYSSTPIYLMLNYEKDGKPHSRYATVDGINIDRPAQSDRKARTLKTTFNGIDMTFALDAAESLTELANGTSTAPLGTWTSVDYTIATLNSKTGQYDEEMGRSTEYSITFSEDGTFTSNLHNDLEGRWELKEIRKDYVGDVCVYRLLASGIQDNSYFETALTSESTQDSLLFITNSDDSVAYYTLRRMSEAEIAAENEFSADAPFTIVGEWFSSDGRPNSAVFNEDGSFTLRSEGEENEKPTEIRGYWHFRYVTEYDGNYTYVYDTETIMDPELVPIEPSDEEATHLEKQAITLSVKDGNYSLNIDNFYAWDWALTNADGVKDREEALAAIVGHWSASGAKQKDPKTEQWTEVSVDFHLDIAPDMSFTGYAGRNISGTLEFLGKDGDAIRYAAHYNDESETSLLVTLDGGVLSIFVSPYSIAFER